jgi:hypothetical protein
MSVGTPGRAAVCTGWRDSGLFAAGSEGQPRPPALPVLEPTI